MEPNVYLHVFPDALVPVRELPAESSVLTEGRALL